MTQELSIIGIDLAKSVFHLVGMDERGKIILRKRLVRVNMTPQAMLWAYWDIRCALNRLGFTPEREQEVQQEEEERVADAQFLIDNRLRPE